MPYRVRIFVDFWNFQLSWNERTNKSRCDWAKLASVLLDACANVVGGARKMELEFVEMRIYASVSQNPGEDEDLKKWLDQFLNRQPGYHVEVRPRHDKRMELKCRACGLLHGACSCGEPFVKSFEKGVDTAIVTDLLGLAWEGAYDLAILVSSDADFVPGVEHIQRKGFRVVNACWLGQGHNLAKACWASLRLDEMIPSLTLVEIAPRPDETPAAEVTADDMDGFVEEMDRAIRHFESGGGYLGAAYFIRRWTSPKLPPPGDGRQRLLEEAIRLGLVELVDVVDGPGSPAKAIRRKRD